MPAIPLINQAFDVEVVAFFSFGSGEGPDTLGTYMQEKDSIIYIDLYYDCMGPFPSLGSASIDTIFISRLNPGIDMLIVNPYSVYDMNTYIDTAAKGDSDTLYFGVTNISESAFNYIKIYPNPTTENIIIENVKALFIEELYLSDIRGRRIKTFDPTSKKLDVSSLNAGQYIF